VAAVRVAAVRAKLAATKGAAV
jgi:colicin import membrane protein